MTFLTVALCLIYRLQEAVDYSSSTCAQAGLLNNDYDRTRVKLHVTLMNTLFRKDRTGTDKPRSKVQKANRETFNAQKISEVSTYRLLKYSANPKLCWLR